MSAFAPATLGLALLAAGVLSGLVVWLAVHLVGRYRAGQAAPFAPLAPTLAPNSEAVLVIQPGGQVVYANPTARSWLGIPDGRRPDLERLARIAEPPESFLGLCSAEGRVRLTIQGLYVEGSSYELPFNGSGAIAVSLRRSQLLALSGSSSELPQEAVDILSELSRAMSASLDLETTLEAILGGISRLVHSDFSEIGLWDPDEAALTYYRYVTDSEGRRTLESDRRGTKTKESLSGYLVSTQMPLLVRDVQTDPLPRRDTDLIKSPIRGYAGVPLLIAGDSIGTLELASLSPDAFRKEDLDLLQLLSGQAAVAVQNALTHEHEQQRLAELTGLANLAQATGALSDPQDLYGRLMQSISPLLEVEILGLMIYEENRRSLEGKNPFIGLPEQFTPLYRAEILPGSPAEEILLSQETILTADAGIDDRFEQLGLMPWIQAAGVVNTALVPIPSGGRALGYIQAANKKDGTQLTQDELRLMSIVAGQIGPIIENANLVQEARRRARQAEAMHRISSLAGSGATLDEILKFAVLELARFMGADFCAVYLLDLENGSLGIHRKSTFGFQAEDPGSFRDLRLEDAAFRSTACGSLRPVIAPDLAYETDLPVFYRDLISALPPSCALISVPMEVRETAIGELILLSSQAGSLGPNEAQVAATAARQLASAVERSSLYSLTDEGLRQKLDHLSALNRISGSLGAADDMPKLLEITWSEAIFLGKADRGSVRFLNLDGSSTSSRPVTGFYSAEPETDLKGHELQALSSGEPVLLNDISDHASLGMMDGQPLSALAVPIRQEERVLGLISLESFRRNHFTPEAITLLAALGTEAASSIERTSRLELYRRENDRLDRQVALLRTLTQTMTTGVYEERLQMELDVLAHEIREAADFRMVAILARRAGSDFLEQIGRAGDETDAFFSAHLTWPQIEKDVRSELHAGRVYRIPAGWPKNERSTRPLLVEMSNEWAAGDRFFIPLQDEAGDWIGLIALGRAQRNSAAGETALSLEPFVERAVPLVSRSRRLEMLEGDLAELGIVMDTEGYGSGDTAPLPPLESASVGQIAAFTHLNQRFRQMRSTLAIAESVNQQPDRPSVLWAFGQEVLKKLGADLALIADRSQSGPRLLHSIGAVPPDANPQASFGQRNPLRECFERGEPIMVSDVSAEPDWMDTPFLNSLDAVAFIALPVAVNGIVEAAMLAVHRSPLPPFRDDDRQIYHMLAVQVGIALQNLDLLTETRRRLREVDLLLDFSRQLGSLDPDEILNTLITSTLQVVGSAHAGMVAVWDEQEGLLRPRAAAGYTDNERIKEITYRSGEALPGRVYARAEPLLVEELNFAERYRLSPENLLLYREATGGRLPVSSMVIPLQAAGSPLGVVLLDNFNTTSAFTLE
ncbi:MAG TPA: GAF domain-containing protein, partial [Anaerolineales bacterium]|nr:GAF domain-containing protein [Anaerolineales bacterium]